MTKALAGQTGWTFRDLDEERKKLAADGASPRPNRGRPCCGPKYRDEGPHLRNRPDPTARPILCTAILDVDACDTKGMVIQRLLQELVRAGHVSEADLPGLLQAVLHREAMASTAIGQGVAVPHVKSPAVKQAVGVLGLCRTAVNFDSIDGRPTDIVLLLLAPPTRPGMDEVRPSRRSGELLPCSPTMDFGHGHVQPGVPGIWPKRCDEACRSRYRRRLTRMKSPVREPRRTLANDFHQTRFFRRPSNSRIKDLLPRAEIELAIGDRDDDFPAHDLAFHVGVGVVFAGAVVAVLRGAGRAGRASPASRRNPAMQAALVVVDVNGRRDVHGVDEAEPFLHAAFRRVLQPCR